jgi:hypothetical protein
MPFNPKTFKTAEFIAFALTTLGAWVGTLTGSVGSNTAVWTTAISATLYALARGVAKSNADVKDFWQTTEFWALALGVGVEVVGYWQDIIGPDTAKWITSLLGLGLALMQYRKQPDVAAGNVPARMVAGALDHDDHNAALKTTGLS